MDRVAADAPVSGAPESLPSVESLLGAEDFRLRLEQARKQRQKVLGGEGRASADLMRDSRPWEKSSPEDVIRRRAADRERADAQRARSPRPEPEPSGTVADPGAAGIAMPGPAASPFDMPLLARTSHESREAAPDMVFPDPGPASVAEQPVPDLPAPDKAGVAAQDGASGPVAAVALAPAPVVTTGTALVVLPIPRAAEARRGRMGLIAAGFVLGLGLGLAGAWVVPRLGPVEAPAGASGISIASAGADRKPASVKEITELSASAHPSDALPEATMPGPVARILPAALPARPERPLADAVPSVAAPRAFEPSPVAATSVGAEPAGPDRIEGLPLLPAAETRPEGPPSAARLVALPDRAPALPRMDALPARPVTGLSHPSAPPAVGLEVGEALAPAIEASPRPAAPPQAVVSPAGDRLAGIAPPPPRPAPSPPPGPDFSAFEVRVMVPDAASGKVEQAAVDSIRSAGFTVQRSKPVGYRVKETHVRYYHEGDRAAAEALAQAVGADVRDFVGTSDSVPAGGLELWLSGVRASAPAGVKPYAKAKVAAKAKSKAKARTGQARLSEAAQAQMLRDRILQKLRAGVSP